MIASTHRRHRATESKKSLSKIDRTAPDHLDMHVISDKYGTHNHPTVKTRLGNHPRFHMHAAPTSNPSNSEDAASNLGRFTLNPQAQGPSAAESSNRR